MLVLLLLAAAAPDACALLSGPEIAAVQGEAPGESKAGAIDQGELHVASCTFVLPTPAKSVSLEVVRGPAAAVRKRWKEIFHGPKPQREAEDVGERAPKRRVRALGEEAFWLPEKPSGALYVLGRQSFLRLSLGGKGPLRDKLARAKALVKKALRRM